MGLEPLIDSGMFQELLHRFQPREETLRLDTKHTSVGKREKKDDEQARVDGKWCKCEFMKFTRFTRFLQL